ncbi:C3 and PZP-like alpha-2-macroglobulin domain-containing protein 8 [Diadema setosum]|uniref:C3 and PZP-like alpha-2-macroglobulin domain-containing protein 8 n=1 Tax=Diadema setosum TaxID=31175 RepID=UPI003B3B487D
MELRDVRFDLLVLTCLCTFLSTLADGGYLVAYPLAFRPGMTERLSVTIFDTSDPVVVEARIRWRNETLTEVGETIIGKGYLLMKLPDHVRGKAVLEVCGNCRLGARGYHFKNSSDITILEKSTSVFIQIDKPVYKPKQTVFINLFTTGPDLRPRNIPMLVYILDPKGSRMIQWNGLEPTCCGIVNTSFPISDQPVLGTWAIFVEVQGHTFNKTFDVNKYVLPRFEVIIEPPRFIRDISKCSRAAIHAKYTFGQPVRGKLSINMNLHGLGYYDDYLGQNIYHFMDINGTAYFNICISALTSAPLKPHFKGVIRVEASVTSSDGSVFTAMDETCMVHKQLVSLEFSPDTKKHFKPGLPYNGKVLLFYPDDSPASSVVVRINVEKNEQVIFRDEFLVMDGEAAFEINNLPDGDGLLWLDALIVRVDGKPAGSSYSMQYLSLGSWYSPSDCHLLMTSEQPRLKVGTMATVHIKSTCPCNFTLHYEVMSRGNIVTSGLHTARRKRQAYEIDDQDPPIQLTQGDGNETRSRPETCDTSLSFMVTAAMSPMSRLLVYYVRDDEEGVVDTLQLDVEPSFENKVSVSWSRNETLPKAQATMVISAKPDSCVCVATVDKSVQLLKPGYQLTPAQVFAEMAKYDLSDGRYEDTFWWSTSFRRKRSPMWNAMRMRDADYAFREAGLRVMTDKVQLRFQGIPGSHEADGPEVTPLKSWRSDQRLDRRRRAYFPETWIFNCFNISSTRRDHYIPLQVPDSITTWQTDVVAMSPHHGLGVATSVPLVAFKDFFIQYTLPYSVIRGEQLRVPLSVFNYMDVCVKVITTVHIQEGVKFLNYGGRTHTLTQCLRAKESLTTQIELVFTELGKKRIHAGAEALMTLSCDCQEEPGRGDIPMSTPLARDKITNSILVEPEGIARGYTYSVFFCPNERIHISTPSYDEYQFVHPPDGMEFFTFLCKATSNAKIALTGDQTDNIFFEIVLGGFINTQSWISRRRRGPKIQTASTPGIVSWDEFRAFWISWSDTQIQIGYGETKVNESVILTLNDPSLATMNVQYIGFATGSGSLGEFRIWKRKGNSEIYHEAFTLTLPLNFVHGSERAQATMIADVMGPTLNNLHNLIRLPFGCGEQNMIHFAPNVYIMRYLQRTNQLTDDVKSEATNFLVMGYQRQLTYKRHDGSYSAFGENDSSGSMWLTAFVLKSFAQSRTFIYIDPREMRFSKNWVVSQQGADGSFPPVGRVLNKDIQGGIQGKVSLTAYVVVALMEAGLDTREERLAVATAQSFLEDNVHPEAISDPYTAALVAYALTLRKSTYAPTAERILSNMAIRRGGMTYWRLSDQPLEALPFFAHMGNIKQTVTSAEVEMTAYALLTYTLLGDIAYSLPIVKWLTQQRNSLGGFSSTQDTCVALQALSEYATLAYVGHVNLNVTLAYTNILDAVEEHFYLNNENSKVLQVMEIPAMSHTLFIGAVGEGCGLMQVDMSYNIPDPSSKEAFKLNVKMLETAIAGNHMTRRRRRRSLVGGDGDGTTNEVGGHHDYRVSMEVCARWLHAGSSNMAVMEVALLSGFSADIESLERLTLDRQNKLKRYEIDGRRVILYFDEISSQCMTCVTFDAYRDYVVGKMQAVPVKVYDYYEPHYEETRFYNVSSASPLARELCEEEHPDCNRVDDQPASREETVVNKSNGDDDLCNTVFSDCHSPADQLRCGCHRSCEHEPGSLICGSDGHVYDNYCFMEVAACQLERPIRAVPLYMCPDRVPANQGRRKGETTSEGVPVRPTNTGGIFPDRLREDGDGDGDGNQETTIHLQHSTSSMEQLQSNSTADSDSSEYGGSDSSSLDAVLEGLKIDINGSLVAHFWPAEDMDDKEPDEVLHRPVLPDFQNDEVPLEAQTSLGVTEEDDGELDSRDVNPEGIQLPESSLTALNSSIPHAPKNTQAPWLQPSSSPASVQTGSSETRTGTEDGVASDLGQPAVEDTGLGDSRQPTGSAPRPPSRPVSRPLTPLERSISLSMHGVQSGSTPEQQSVEDVADGEVDPVTMETAVGEVESATADRGAEQVGSGHSQDAQPPPDFEVPVPAMKTTPEHRHHHHQLPPESWFSRGIFSGRRKREAR